VARSRSIDQRTAALRTLDVSDPASPAVLRDALASANGTLIALAAKIVADHQLFALASDVAAAFADLCTEDRVKRDPLCRGKLAIIRALHDLDHWDERAFVAAVHVTQIEGYDREDTAAVVRGLGGLAYARLLRIDAADVLAELLTDKHKTARLAAVQALGNLGRADLTALLRFKLLAGTDDAEIESACFESLLSMAPESSIEFAARFLDEHSERAEIAAIALGGTRDPRALEPLVRFAATTMSRSRDNAYLALALLRLDAATRVLTEAIRNGGAAQAIAAVKALATFKDDPAALRDLRGSIAARKEAAIRRDLEALLA
jgi:HEAT repeat protein